MLITILCSVMIVISIFLVVAVLMQSGKDSHLSGTIAGGAETFFGKTKGKTIDRVLSKVTTIVSIIFVILVLVVYVLGSYEENNSVSGQTDIPDALENAVDGGEEAGEAEVEGESTDGANSDASTDGTTADGTAADGTTADGAATGGTATEGQPTEGGAQTGDQNQTADTAAN